MTHLRAAAQESSEVEDRIRQRRSRRSRASWCSQSSSPALSHPRTASPRALAGPGIRAPRRVYATAPKAPQVRSHVQRSKSYRQGVADGWTSTAAGRHLAGRVSTSTAPEIALRRALHASGLRFRLHPAVAKGCTPDLVLPRHRVAMFVDGCFWHGCPLHGRKTPWTGPNRELWAQKMERNRQRDERSTKLAQDAGWTVLRVWEHEVTGDVAAIVEAVRAASTPAGPRPARP
ncbi:very short patch repair endonuclease [Cellulosimicrobium cellulans]|uniref:very short patch repair endonuclease n=1 Tax=Cellulosimicrobium cellulans TaxID=1710 RepID=UPI0036EE3095